MSAAGSTDPIEEEVTTIDAPKTLDDQFPRATQPNPHNFTKLEMVQLEDYIHSLKSRFPNIPEDMLRLSASYYLKYGDEQVSREIEEGKFD